MSLGPDGIKDALNVIAASPLGAGRVDAADEVYAFYRDRYGNLGPRVLRFLRALNNSDATAIRFVRTRDFHGRSSESGGATWRGRMLLSQEFDLNDDTVGLSVCLVHEAIHLMLRGTHVLDEEVICRGMEKVYIRQLARGVPRPTRLAGPLDSHLGSRTNVTTDDILVTRYRNDKMYQARITSVQLIDWVLWIGRALGSYRGELSIDWIDRAADWWGGLSVRRPETLGMYLDNILYNHYLNPRTMNLVLRILEAMPGTDVRFPDLPSHPDVSTFRGAAESMLSFLRGGGLGRLQRYFRDNTLTTDQERRLTVLQPRWRRHGYTLR